MSEPEVMTVAKLTEGTSFTGFLLVRSGEARMGKTGSPYLDLNLGDRTGEINCKKWNTAEQAPAAGTVVKVMGRTENYNGRLQFRIEKLRAATPADPVDMSLLVPAAPEKPEDMRREIDETIGRFASEDLRKLVREMIQRAGDELDWFPAAQRLHHAERSGLLHHTVSMLRLAEHVIQAYPVLQGDLLRAGVIVHDLCKIQEMKSDALGNVQDYSKDGLLIGHLVRGVTALRQAADAVGVQGELVLLMEHMMLSHHGIPEYGSPRAPMFLEAEVLHWLDILDARINEMGGIQDRTPAGAFSEKIWSLDRRVYHPLYGEALGEAADSLDR